MEEKDIEQKVTELVKLTIQQKDCSEKIKDIKAEIKEYCEINNINDHVWMADNGYVEVKTETKYKLADIPADVKIDSNLDIANDIADEAFKFKASLTKEGKKLFRENHHSIVNLMIPSIKKFIKINV